MHNFVIQFNFCEDGIDHSIERLEQQFSVDSFKNFEKFSDKNKIIDLLKLKYEHIRQKYNQRDINMSLYSDETTCNDFFGDFIVHYGKTPEEFDKFKNITNLPQNFETVEEFNTYIKIELFNMCRDLYKQTIAKQ